MGSWHQIKTFVYMLMRDRAMYIAHTQIYIVNAGAQSGLAKKLGAELTRFGFTVAETMNASDDRKSPLMAMDHSMVSVRTEEDKSYADYFSTLLKIPTGTLPVDFDPERLGQITIVLGKDYAYQSLQDLIGLPPDPEPASSSSSDASAAASSSSTAP